MARTRLGRVKENIKGIIDSLSALEMDLFLEMFQEVSNGTLNPEFERVEQEFNDLEDIMHCEEGSCPNYNVCNVRTGEDATDAMCNDSCNKYYSQEVE